MIGAVFYIDALFQLARLTFPSIHTTAFAVRTNPKGLPIVIAILFVSTQGQLTRVACEPFVTFTGATAIGVPESGRLPPAIAIFRIDTQFQFAACSLPSGVARAFASFLLGLVGLTMAVTVIYSCAPLQLTLFTSEFWLTLTSAVGLVAGCISVCRAVICVGTYFKLAGFAAPASIAIAAA